MKINKRIIFLVCAALIIVTSLVVATFADNSFKTVKSVFDENNGLVTQGTIESKEVSINSKLPGRIAKIFVEEGMQVKEGDILVEISSDEIQAKYDQCEALVNAAKAAYDVAVSQQMQAVAGLSAAKSKVIEAQAGVDASKNQEAIQNSTKNKADNGARNQEIASAQAAYDLYKSTYDRVKTLYEKGAVSAQKVDEVKTQLTVAYEQLSMAKEGARSEDKNAANLGVALAGSGIEASIARLTQAQAGEQVALAQVSMAQSGVTAKKAQLDQAQAGLDEVNAYLKDTKIIAPISGTVTVLNASEGELVSSGMSIATVSNASEAWVEVQVKETDLGSIHEGQTVEVKLPSYKDKTFNGRVLTINKKPDFATKRATNENGQFDIVSFGVKINLENVDEQLRPGMSAFVQFKKE